MLPLVLLGKTKPVQIAVKRVIGGLPGFQEGLIANEISSVFKFVGLTRMSVDVWPAHLSVHACCIHPPTPMHPVVLVWFAKKPELTLHWGDPGVHFYQKQTKNNHTSHNAHKNDFLFRMLKTYALQLITTLFSRCSRTILSCPSRGKGIRISVVPCIFADCIGPLSQRRVFTPA